MADLTFKTRDIHGDRPPTYLLGSKWQHSGNKHVYTVTGFSWLGADDVWGFTMRRAGCDVPVTRPLGHLHGWRENGEKRYTRVFESTSDEIMDLIRWISERKNVVAPVPIKITVGEDADPLGNEPPLWTVTFGDITGKGATMLEALRALRELIETDDRDAVPTQDLL